MTPPIFFSINTNVWVCGCKIPIPETYRLDTHTSVSPQALCEYRSHLRLAGAPRAWRGPVTWTISVPSPHTATPYKRRGAICCGVNARPSYSHVASGKCFAPHLLLLFLLLLQDTVHLFYQLKKEKPKGGGKGKATSTEAWGSDRFVQEQPKTSSDLQSTIHRLVRWVGNSTLQIRIG